jgi:hypothetical protein
LVGHLGVLDEHGNPRGGFASHVGEGMFAIGYGIPPNGPLRAIRVNATPLAREVAGYLKRIGSIQQCRTVDGGISLPVPAVTARAEIMGAQ